MIFLTFASNKWKTLQNQLTLRLEKNPQQEIHIHFEQINPTGRKTKVPEATIKFTIQNDSSKRYNVRKRNEKPKFCKIKAIINIPCVEIVHDPSDSCSHSVDTNEKIPEKPTLNSPLNPKNSHQSFALGCPFCGNIVLKSS